MDSGGIYGEISRKINGELVAADPASATTDAVAGAAEPLVEATRDAGDQAAALSPEKKWAARIRPHLEAGVAGYIAAGLEAIQAKRDLKKQPGASFVHMIETELGENIDAVQKYMAIARNPFFAETANLRFLPTAWTTLYVLSPLKPKVLEELAEVGRLHPALTGAEATALVRLVRASNGRKRGRIQDRDRDHDDEVDNQGDERGGDRDGRHGADHDGDHSQDQRLGEDHGDDHGRGLDADQDGDLGDGRGEDLNRDVGDGDRSSRENALSDQIRNDIGSNSDGEIARKLARLEDLEHETRRQAIQLAGYESEIQELKAKLNEAPIRHQRRLFRQVMEAMQKVDASNIPAKEKYALHNDVITDLTELVRSAARDGLSISCFDVYCRPEVH